MSITNGSYEITSALSPDCFLGSRAGDFSMLPKPIVTLPGDVEDIFRQWVAVEADNGTFILKIANNPTADIDGGLKTVLMPVEEPTPTKWRITPVPQHGEDAYVVTVAENEAKGWVLDSSNDELELPQSVYVRFLVVGLSEPPFYPQDEVFIFKRIDLDVE